MLKMDVWTFWSQLSSSYAFYIVPSCIRNHHTKFEIERNRFSKAQRYARKMFSAEQRRKYSDT